MEEKYFAASNSADGFCSYYDGVFGSGSLVGRYIIKGGSGTGKATFMRRVARRAESQGYGVRYIYCSSDAESLDGIVIEEKGIAVLDGTAPHVFEPRLLGVRDHLIDLGTFLDNDMLLRQRSEIERLSAAKSESFTRAYRFLRAYREVCGNIQSVVMPALRMDKIRTCAGRIACALSGGEGGEHMLPIRAVGMRGLSSFDTYRERARLFYSVNDYFDTAHIFMSELRSALTRRRVEMNISPNPIIPSRTDAILDVGGGVAFEISCDGRGAHRTVNMKRFVDADSLGSIRSEYRSLARLRDEILCAALAEFEKIRDLHFGLEKIYGSAMDFEAKEHLCDEFCNKIFQNN